MKGKSYWEGKRKFVKTRSMDQIAGPVDYRPISSKQHLIPSCNGLETMPNVRWNFEESNAEYDGRGAGRRYAVEGMGSMMGEGIP